MVWRGQSVPNVLVKYRSVIREYGPDEARKYDENVDQYQTRHLHPKKSHLRLG